MQKQYFKEELETLETKEKVKFDRSVTFQLYLDEQGLIRSIVELDIEYFIKFPLHQYLWIQKIVSLRKILKIYTNSTLNKFKEMMHGLGIKNPVKKLVSKCMNCRRIRASRYPCPVQPDLPRERYLMEIPFTCTSIDCWTL